VAAVDDLAEMGSTVRTSPTAPVTPRQSGGAARPAEIGRDEARRALGDALQARADEVAALAAARAFPGVKVDLDQFSSSVTAARLVGRYLSTGKTASASEHQSLARNGEMPLTGGTDLGNVTKSYLAWRDAVCDVIRQEAQRLGADEVVLGQALMAAQRSSDASLVRMARHFDTTRKELEKLVREERERLTRTALHDRLTGLPNRTSFVDQLDLAMAEKQDGEDCCVLFVDLDNFKSVNDHFGHRAGDRLLVAVGRRLVQAARRTDVVARFGGDEFVVLARGLCEVETEALAVAERIRSVLERPFRLAGRLVMVSASIGITPAGTQSPDEIVMRADQAMYEAKREGRNRVAVYSPELGQVIDYRSRLAHDLHFATQHEQLSLVFQPIFSADGRVSGAEALLRWSHPNLGPVPPSEFIPVAEETGLIDTIGTWVLRRAVEQCRTWRDDGAAEASISVNVSAHQLSPSYVDLVREVLEEAGLPPEALKLELTESALLPDAPGSAEALDGLGELGVGLQIDDFGTGYSSLAYLRRLPVQALKIDRSFVSGLGDDGADRPIVRAMIELAHQLGLGVIAEGVETESELETLRQMGCDRFQGFLLGRPAPASELAWSHD
jgi:diguanylate cyclase (GGDEF)-like protein